MINRLIKKPNGIHSLTKVILQGKQLFRWRFLHTWKENYMAAISLQSRNKNMVVFVVLFLSWKLLSGRMTIRCQFLIGRELSSCENSFSFQVYLLAHTVCLYANLLTIFWTKILYAYKWSLILETQIHDSNIVFADWNQRTCQRFNNLCSFSIQSKTLSVH